MAAFPVTFRYLPKRKRLSALWGLLALIQCGAWVGVHAQDENFGAVSVGTTSATPISVTLSSVEAERLGSIELVTKGAAGLGFANAGTGARKAGTEYIAGATCTVNAAGVAVDSTNCRDRRGPCSHKCHGLAIFACWRSTFSNGLQ